MLELNENSGLPIGASLAKVLGSTLAGSISPYMDGVLLDLAADLLARPSKRFRARLVELSYGLCRCDDAPTKSRELSLCAQAVELLHAGSLIVDDIQDGSATRRGSASIHKRYGIPGAICAGNWLYFWPLRLLQDLRLPAAIEHRMYTIYHDTLERAHYGQALDLKLQADQVPRDELPQIAAAVSELKTGSVTALAMQLGAMVAGADGETLTALGHFGRRFGVALQTLDDLGNMVGRNDVEKRCEDLTQRKVTAAWAYAASLTTKDDYQRFVAAVLAGAPWTELDAWLAETAFISMVSDVVQQELDAAFHDLSLAIKRPANHPILSEIHALAESMLHAYV